MKRNQAFRSRGQAVVVLGLLISVLILFALGLYNFELSRVESARNQLRSAVEAACLAGAASLAGSDNTDTAVSQQAAMDTALQMFRQNNVIGVPLTTAGFASSASQVPSANSSLIFVQFLDPNKNNTVVPLGNPSGKTLQITGLFGLVPAFGTFLGLPQLTLLTVTSGGVPALDLVVCFDISGSIDDQTRVTFVKRQWQASTGKVIYPVASTSGASPAGRLAQGTIFDILGPPYTGTRVNGVYPENLGLADSGVSYPLAFSPSLRGSPDQGSPPGNYPPQNNSLGNSQTFTDMVVNIDGKTIFSGFTTPDGYSFPDIGTVVEAARGNLEDPINFLRSKANLGVPSSIQPRAGYQAKYFSLAAANLHPLSDAQAAAAIFFTVLNNDTNAHFGLVTFSDSAGAGPTDSYNDYKIDSSYSVAGSARIMTPTISLNSSPTVSNYSAVEAVIPSLVATTSTNIGDAVNTAVTQLKNQARPGSKKAIILFTDGEPTTGGPLSSDPWTNARNAAVVAKKAGIPIYTIGLAQNPAIIPSETSILNDSNPNPASGGMAAIAGNGGQFFLVTDASQLRFTFEHIARCLVQLVKA
jgi:hypothetical protein